MFFFFNDTATTEIYTLSLRDALPIFDSATCASGLTSHRTRLLSGKTWTSRTLRRTTTLLLPTIDRKSTRLNSSHANISYAVFCLKNNNDLHSCPPLPDLLP